jgi:uncharacterized protein (TIGR02757 family)
MTPAAGRAGRATRRSGRSFPLWAGTSTAPGLSGSLASQRLAFEALRGGDRTGVSPSVAADPVFFAHRYAEPGDREIAATVAALFAYGQVAVMARTIEEILARLGPHPRASLLADAHRRPGWSHDLRYRFQGPADVVALLRALRDSLDRWGGLGPALAHHAAVAGPPGGDGLGLPAAESGLSAWVATLRRAAGRDTAGLRHLLADPATGGTAKRWRLLLRWMVRPADGIDLGLWEGLFSPAELVLPLDTHWIRIGPRLGLTVRRTPDARMAREITAGLRRLAPVDPLRYDLALCHLGISGACPPRLEPRHCAACPLRRACRTGASLLPASRPTAPRPAPRRPA